ncbi:hypothetical protein [Rhizobium sp. MHM7A]|uniref:hypothetical protein n=1 Tax=Rhizobium sp. MHM7A TaxID=2583233 RepID=UPI00110727DA|nr:hypothetical protein [Rhizobium sp. MHM7A]TLX17256.1 hypothetical protein FFR93_08135 [Rhizobium sp. MHM7A]
MPKLSHLVAGRTEELTKKYHEFLQSGSEIVEGDETSKEFDPDLVDAAVFDIEVDGDDLIVPFGLREAGLLAKTENGELTENVLDTAINMILNGVEVLIEFPSDVDCGEPVHLVSTAAAIKASLSFLPPENASDEQFEAWCQRIERLTEAYLRQPNMTQFVLPVSSYVEYMFINVLDSKAAKKFKPTDEYIIRRFHSAMTVARANAMKARVRKIVHAHFGGREKFKEFAKEMFSSIYETVVENVKQRASEITLANPANEVSTGPTE